MVKARVTLTGSLSHEHGGRRMIKGQPQVITNPAEILYYQQQSGFSVVVLDGENKPTEKKVEAKKEEVKEEVKEEESKDAYTKDQLQAMKKRKLVDVAAEVGVLLEGSEKKSRMIAAILKAQK